MLRQPLLVSHVRDSVSTLLGLSGCMLGKGQTLSFLFFTALFHKTQS